MLFRSNVLVNSSMGIALGTELIFLFSAFSLASNVAYVVSVASIHIMITSVGAFFILKETFTREKVMAIALVVISSILFALG